MEQTDKRRANLIPIASRSKEQIRNMGSLGGIKSAQTHKRKKELRDTLQQILGLKVTNEAVLDQMRKYGVKSKKDQTLQTQVIISLVVQASKGNVRAYEAIRDTLGENRSVLSVETNEVDTSSAGINIQTINALKESKVEGFEEFDTEGDIQEIEAIETPSQEGNNDGSNNNQ